MAEWSNAAVLKTVVPQGTGGSNPSSSAPFYNKFIMQSSNYFNDVYDVVKLIPNGRVTSYGSIADNGIINKNLNSKRIEFERD